ncbi:unnamed protein product, partial [Musa banksii]
LAAAFSACQWPCGAHRRLLPLSSPPHWGSPLRQERKTLRDLRPVTESWPGCCPVQFQKPWFDVKGKRFGKERSRR